MEEASQKRYRRLRVLLIALLLAGVIALVGVALYVIMPGLLKALESRDTAALQTYLHGFSGADGILHCALLQALQALSIILPGMPIELAAGAVLGTWRAFFACTLGYAAANMLVFSLARKLGRKMDRLLPFTSERTRLSFILNSPHPGFMVTLANILPILPNGIIPYVAARTKITPLRYLAALLVGFAPSTLFFCSVGNRLLAGGLKPMLYVGGGALLLVLLVYLNRTHISTAYERYMAHKNARRPR